MKLTYEAFVNGSAQYKFYWNRTLGRKAEARVAAGDLGAHADFWALVQVGAVGECWPWLGPRTEKGYGRWDGTGERAHRVAWEVTRGRPLPDGLRALHTCDNPPCCNPAHVWAGTDAENVRDCVRKGRRAGQHGELNHRSKLTAQQVAEIRARKGEDINLLGAEYKISPQHVSNLQHGRFWKDS